jgi:hypothetical protein
MPSERYQAAGEPSTPIFQDVQVNIVNIAGRHMLPKKQAAYFLGKTPAVSLFFLKFLCGCRIGIRHVGSSPSL